MNGYDVRKIRTRVDMSQSEFCETYGLNIFTLRQWERKNTVLDMSVSSYLTCISKDPKVIQKLLNEPMKKSVNKK